MSLACLFIPTTTILTLVIPGIGLWETNQLSSVMVELVALVFSGLFYYSACKTKHRAYYGERNSIWALSSVPLAEVVDNRNPPVVLNISSIIHCTLKHKILIQSTW